MASKRRIPAAELDLSHGAAKRLNIGKRNLDKYQQQGQDLARKGKYEEALRAFGNALLRKNIHEPDVLDSRSAVYCKMGLYAKALSDAKRMIKADNQDERGYLRAGKALLLLKRPEKAIDVYEYGLKTLDERHLHREVLQNIHSKLSTRMESQCRDPVQYLNNDILLQIFEHIPFRQRARLTRVSKTWKDYIRGQPSFWLDLSFTGLGPPASVDTVKKCIQYSLKRVKRIQIRNVKNALNSLQLAYQCPKLEHLYIDCKVTEDHLYKLFQSKHTLKTLIISGDTRIKNQHAVNLLKLPNLEHFEVHRYVMEASLPMTHGLPLMNMKCLRLGVSPTIGRTVFLPFWIRRPAGTDEIYCEQIPKLETFHLAGAYFKKPIFGPLSFCLDCICYPNFKTISLEHLQLGGLFRFHENLEYLTIACCDAYHVTWIDNEREFMLPKLKSLTLQDLDWVRFFHVDRMLKHNSGVLENLKIVLCGNFTLSELEELIGSVPDAFRNLKSLQVYGMGLYDLPDRVAFQVLEKMPLLKELHVPHTKVTGSLIRKIIQSRDQPPSTEETTKKTLPGIDVLNLTGCEDVSTEAVEWGRLNGLKILRQSSCLL